MSDHTEFSVDVLGCFDVLANGVSVGPGPESRRSRLLLAILALHPHTMLTKRRLAELIWEGEPPPSAANSIEKFVSTWRKVLPDQVVQTVGQGYRLALEPSQCDLYTFREAVRRARAANTIDRELAMTQLSESLGRWPESAMEKRLGEHLPAAAVPTLIQEYLDALEACSEHFLEHGRGDIVESRLAAALQEFPFRERTASFLMWSYYQRNQQERAMDIFLAIRRHLAEELGADPGGAVQTMYQRILDHDQSLDGKVVAALPSAVSNVPVPTTHFTGRDRELAALQRKFDLVSAESRGRNATAICGLNGVGKTQFSLEFADRNRDRYECVWRVNARTASSTARGLEELAERIGVSLPADRERHLNEVWLATARFRRWLLIFDEAGTPADLAEYWPPNANVDILLTSVNPDWATRADTIELKVFDDAEAEKFLSDRAADSDLPTIRRLASALGYLPIALQQATSYMTQTGMSPARYLPLLQRWHTELLTRGVPEDHRETLDVIWRMAMRNVEAACPGAVQLLQLCAFLSPVGIAAGMLHEASGVLPEPLRSDASRELGLEDVILAARRFSLLSRQNDTVTMHCLLQAVVADSMSDGERADWEDRTGRMLVALGPSSADEPAQWPRWESLIPHIMVISAIYARTHHAPAEFVQLLLHAARYLVCRASFDDAYYLLTTAKELVESIHGPSSPQMGKTLTELGDVLEKMGRYPAAQQAQEQAVTILHACHGPDHPWAARAILRLSGVMSCNQGLSLWQTADLPEAESKFTHSLGVLVAALGADHPIVAQALAGLGHIRQDRGDLAGALVCHQRALQLLEATLGPEHPDVGHQCDRLGYTERLNGQYDAARRHHERALRILEIKHGVGSLDTAWSHSNLGLVLLAVGDTTGALTRQVQAQSIFRESPSGDCPYLIARWREARIYLAAGSAEKAAAILEAVVPALARELGPDHPDAAAAAADLNALKQTTTTGPHFKATMS